MRYYLSKQFVLLFGCALAIGACSMASSPASGREGLAQDTGKSGFGRLAAADSSRMPVLGPADKYGRHNSAVWLGDRMAVEDWVYEETSPSSEDRITQEAHARFLEALLEAGQGNLEQAMASLDLARQARPGDEDIPLAVARLYLRERDLEKAIKAAEQVLAGHPDSLEAHLILAEANMSLSRGGAEAEGTKTAIEHFEAARKISPGNLQVLIPLGQIYWDRFHRASTPEMRQERGGDVISVYEDVAEATRGRNRRIPLLVLGSLYEITGQREAAESYFEQAIEADRGYTSSYLQAGDFYLRSNNKDKALETFRKALIVNPGDIQVQKKIDGLLGTESGEELLAFYGNLVKEFRLNPDYPKIYAERLVGYGKLEEAAEAYKTAAEHDAQDFATRLTLAKILVQLRRGTEASPYLRQAEASGERTPAFLGELSALYSASGQDNDARRLLREAAKISTDEEKPGYLTRLGALLADSGDVEGAIEVIGQAKALQPEDPRAYLLLSWFCKDDGRYDEALAALDEGLLNVSEDRKLDIQGQRVVLLDQLNRPLETLKALDEMRKLSSAPEQLRDIDLLRADAMMKAGNFGEAEKILVEMKDSADTPETHRRRAWIQLSGLYEEKGEIERSLDAMDHALPGVQGEALIYISRRRAQLLADLERYAMAEELLLATLEQAKGSASNARSIRLQLAELYYVTDRFAEAERTYLEVIEANPADSDARLQLGMVYDKQRRDEEAEAQYRKVMELNPGNAEAYNTLGYMYAVRGVKLVEARQLIERALELKPGAAHIVDSLGWVYYQMGNIDDAIAQLEIAANEIPDPEVLEHLGDAYVKADRIEDARAIYQKALEAEPDREEVSVKLKALQRPEE